MVLTRTFERGTKTQEKGFHLNTHAGPQGGSKAYHASCICRQKGTKRPLAEMKKC